MLVYFLHCILHVVYGVSLFLCVLLQMTGHKRILSIVYARWLVGPSCAQWHNWKGTLDWRQYGGQSYERAHHKTDARKIKANGFWLTCFDQMQSYFISIKRITSIVSFIVHPLSLLLPFLGPDHGATYRGDGKNTPMKHDAKSLTDDMDRMQDLKSGTEQLNRSLDSLLALVIFGLYLRAWHA